MQSTCITLRGRERGRTRAGAMSEGIEFCMCNVDCNVFYGGQGKDTMGQTTL